ncbi:DUF7002 family protein [Jannaschia sp. KMU-145]|uniref:DUF7002 family protein n=1 Tax=Jannaschia halovivens TaxID=3388667 RepID=UPI00396AFCF6
MTPEAFAARIPVLWRVSEPGSAEGIRQHGLLTAGQIGARTGIDMTARRPRPVRSNLPDGTPITITDNGPLSLRKLATKLDDGLTPEAWLAMLNDRVFFWPDRGIGANNAKARAKMGLGVEWHGFDTRALLGPVWDRAEIAPFNTGATVHDTPRRGRATFAPLKGLDWEAWRRARRDAGIKTGLDVVREVTVRGGVPHAGEALMQVIPG